MPMVLGIDSSRPRAESIPAARRASWLDRHFAWREFLDRDLAKTETPAPERATDYLAYAGTVALVLLAVQMATGLLMLVHYKPDPTLAFDSLTAIRSGVPHGLLFSNLHAAGSKLLILVVFVHMCRIMLVAAYRGPREPQWYAGIALMALMLLAGFSGYLLPWSQQSYWASVIGTESVRALPFVGDGLVRLLRGGEAVSGPTLSRFYAMHVALIPMGLLVLVWLHVKLVWRTGVIAPADMYATVDGSTCARCGLCEKTCPFGAIRMFGPHLMGSVPLVRSPRPAPSERSMGKPFPVIHAEACNACRACIGTCPSGSLGLRSDRRPYRREPIYPHNVLHRLMAVVAALIVVFGLAYFATPFTKTPADPMLTPDRIKPEWYFLAPYQMLKLLPNETAGLLAIAALNVLVVCLPKLDPRGQRDLGDRPVFRVLIIGGMALVSALTLWGLVS